MKRKIQLAIAAVVLIVGAVVFYFYFPEIWGEAIYPLEYKEEILSASKEFNIDRNLIAAVIYTESHFNKDAGSHAGAKGLMQLIPATARAVAKQLGIDNYTDDKIFDPAINIRLGTAYLRSSLDSRGGNLDVALVNYNAGPGYAGSFQRAFNRTTLPRETDYYVRKVKSVWGSYERIYGKNWEGAQKPFILKKQGSFISKINIKNLLELLLK